MSAQLVIQPPMSTFVEKEDIVVADEPADLTRLVMILLLAHEMIRPAGLGEGKRRQFSS